jgi:hypothetical protein
LKSYHDGLRQDTSSQRFGKKRFTSAELHHSRESASLRTGVNNKMMRRFAPSLSK